MAEPRVTVGDLLPEDAYDAGDPFDVRLRIIDRLVADLVDHPDAPFHSARRRLAINKLADLNDEALGFLDRLTIIHDRLGDED